VIGNAATLILPPRYTEDSVALWRAAVVRDWKVERLHGWKAPSGLTRADVAIYGETFFAAAIAEQLGFTLVSPPLDWLIRIPRGYLRRTMGFTTLGDARRYSDRLFWKPADDKLFPAQVYASGGELPAPGELSSETPVLFSEPVEWSVEYRCFVLQREVVTLSPYWRDGQLAQADDGSWPATPAEFAAVDRFARQVAADPEVPASAGWVLDVGYIANAGWAVIEANPAWGAGLYGCDPGRVLDVLRATCASAASHEG
jgi:hypothetical protein